MITEAILEFMHLIAETLFGWAATALPAPPTFWSDAVSALSTAFGLIPSSVRYFVPIGPVVAAGTAFVVLVGVLGLVRLARRVVSLFTGGGGMA